jgi:hypothetical protein
MLKPANVTLLLALCFPGWALAQSQQPPSRPAETQTGHQGKVESNQQTPSNSQNGADEIPIATIRIVGPKPNAAEPTAQHTNESRDNSTDWWMFGATVGIGFIGLLQLIAFITQAIYMRKSAKEMENTTAAANQVSDDQIAFGHQIERAYMSAGGGRQPPRRLTPIEIAQAGLGPESFGQVYMVESEWFQFDVNNHGKTPGEILEYGYGWCAVDKVANLPEFPDYRWVAFRDQIGPGTQSRGIKRIKIPPDEPVIFGRIGYKDIFGKLHSHGFMQEIGKPIAPPHPSYTETDPPWDVPNVGKRNYQEEEPQS